MIVLYLNEVNVLAASLIYALIIHNIAHKSKVIERKAQVFVFMKLQEKQKRVGIKKRGTRPRF
ncbi:hypothetical protein TE101_10775 [Alteromonas macleodii]|nr:hypothetical protein TE101_10775 [Alteromonas macleodii]